MVETRRRNRDPHLTQRAQQLRREPTEPEVRLWRHLSNRQLDGLKFRRQGQVPPFIGDFFCPALGLVVEIDGHTHDLTTDAARDAHIERLDFHVFRVTNTDVMTNIEGVLTALSAFAAALSPRIQWRLAAGPPHPNPSPEGEGLS